MREGEMRKVTVILAACGLWLMASASCYAGLAVSVTAGSDWDVGTIGMGVIKETTADTWTITGSPDGYENIYIKADGTTWHPGETSGVDQFVLRHDVPTAWGDPITNVDNGIILKADLATAGTQAFDLQFQAPATGSAVGPHTLTVTLTAANWVDPCDAVPCAENDGAGNCTVAAVAGEPEGFACLTCDGVSTTPVYTASGTQDSEGVYLCNASCESCDGAGTCLTCAWTVTADYYVDYAATGSSVYCTAATDGTLGYWPTSTAADRTCSDNTLSTYGASAGGHTRKLRCDCN